MLSAGPDIVRDDSGAPLRWCTKGRPRPPDFGLSGGWAVAKPGAWATRIAVTKSVHGSRPERRAASTLGPRPRRVLTATTLPAPQQRPQVSGRGAFAFGSRTSEEEMGPGSREPAVRSQPSSSHVCRTASQPLFELAQQRRDSNGPNHQAPPPRECWGSRHSKAPRKRDVVKNDRQGKSAFNATHEAACVPDSRLHGEADPGKATDRVAFGKQCVAVRMEPVIPPCALGRNRCLRLDCARVQCYVSDDDSSGCIRSNDVGVEPGTIRTSIAEEHGQGVAMRAFEHKPRPWCFADRRHLIWPQVSDVLGLSKEPRGVIHEHGDGGPGHQFASQPPDRRHRQRSRGRSATTPVCSGSKTKT